MASKYDIESFTSKGYKVTAKQIEQIKLKNVDAIRAFFLDNFEKLSNFIAKYYKKSKLFGYNHGSYDEFLNQLYIDLPYLNYDCHRLFVASVYNNSCYFLHFGGYCYIREENIKLTQSVYRHRDDVGISIDACVDDDGEALYFLESRFSTPFNYNEGYHYYIMNEVFKVLKSNLSHKQRLFFKHYYIEGLSARVIAERFNIPTSYQVGVNNKIALNYLKIVERLSMLDCDFIKPYIGIESERYFLALNRKLDYIAKNRDRARIRRKNNPEAVKAAKARYNQKQREKRRKAQIQN